MKMSLIFSFLSIRSFCGEVTRQCGLVIVVVFVIFLYGCQNGPTSCGQPTQWAENLSEGAPTNFIKQVVQSDRLIITNRFPEELRSEYKDFTLKISGRRLKKIITAITLLKGNSSGVSPLAVCAWHLEFYRGTNLLATANFQDHAILWGKDYYDDQTGELHKLYEELIDKVAR